MNEEIEGEWLMEEDTAIYKKLKIYEDACVLADEIWDVVADWSDFYKETVGKQWVRSADSIGANLSEGSGRGTTPELIRFSRIARGSLCETQHWARRAVKRRLIEPKFFDALNQRLTILLKQLNAFITYQKNKL